MPTWVGGYWMDKHWVDRQEEEWKDVQMISEGCMRQWVSAWIGGPKGGQREEWKEWQINEWLDRWMDGFIDRQIDEWMNRRKKRQLDGWVDG